MSTDWTCFASWSSHHRVHQEVQELSQEVLDMGMFIAECAPLQIEVGSTEAVPPSYLRPFLSLRPLPQLRPLCPLYPLCHLRPLRPLHSREYLASGGESLPPPCKNQCQRSGLEIKLLEGQFQGCG